MNEQIEQLALLCYEECGDYHIGSNSQFNHQKFAELIVRECANICFSEAESHSMAFGEHCGVVIKEHFGVEE